MTLEGLGIQGALHTPYFFVHGERGDPKEFFDGLEENLQDRLLGAIKHFADTEQLGSDRGHTMPWEYETSLEEEFRLWKLKVKGETYRFYSVLHGEGSTRKNVIVYGYKAPKSGKRKEKDDPRERREKKLAEKCAKLYKDLDDCQGNIQ